MNRTTGWWVVANPVSGRRLDAVAEARAALERSGLAHEFSLTAGHGDASRLVTEGIAAGYRRFAVVGGDGTTEQVADALMDHDWSTPPALGVIPIGSGSDFVRTFGFGRSVSDAVARLADGEPYPIDVGRVDGPWGRRHFVNVADIGIAAATIPVAMRLPRWLGGTRYPAAFWLVLPRFRTAEVEVEVGDRTYRGPAINVVIANGQFFGGGMNVAPKAMLMDGEFDVQVFTGPKRHAVTLMPRVMRGLHLRHSGVRRFTGPEVSVRVTSPWPVDVDGELLDVTNELRASILPAALHLQV